MHYQSQLVVPREVVLFALCTALQLICSACIYAEV